MNAFPFIANGPGLNTVHPYNSVCVDQFIMPASAYSIPCRSGCTRRTCPRELRHQAADKVAKPDPDIQYIGNDRASIINRQHRSPRRLGGRVVGVEQGATALLKSSPTTRHVSISEPDKQPARTWVAIPLDASTSSSSAVGGMTQLRRILFTISSRKNTSS